MLNRELEVTLNLAFKEARAKRHEFMTVEHLLLALLDNEAAATVLRACGANLDKLRRDLQEFIDSTTPLIPQHDDERETQPTLGFQRVLQRAVFHVQSSGKREVTGANVLVAIFSEQESQAVFLLKQQSIARIDVVNYIAHGISKVPGMPNIRRMGSRICRMRKVASRPRPTIRWTPMPVTSTNWLARGGSTRWWGVSMKSSGWRRSLPAGARTTRCW